jgi:hypothetical protein
MTENWKTRYSRAITSLDELSAFPDVMPKNEYRDDCLNYLEKAKDALEMAWLAYGAAFEAEREAEK